jgi:long-chain fatty acid transport protein
VINLNGKRLLPLATLVGLGIPFSALATNGMNLEGYGPIAHGMGGASMAYDNGTAALMNNPATLGLMEQGNRIDVALGRLGPNITSSNDFGSADSSATDFYMPAAGWAMKVNQFTYGVGMFAQGGMGAEYSGGSAVDMSGPGGISFLGQPNTDSHTQRSELGVGRLIVPFNFSVNKKLNLAATLDYVWGGLDIMWSMDARNFLGALDMANINDLPSPISGNTGNKGFINQAVGPQNIRGKVSGSLVDRFIAAFDTASYGGPNAGVFDNFYWGHFDFSDGSSLTQKAMGTGFGGKLGATYQFNDQFTIGATYHTKTNMDDFKGDVTTSFKVDTTAAAGQVVNGAVIPVTGEVSVVDFQWPETYGLGMAYKPMDKLLLVADYKRINWSDVMKNFHLRINYDSTQADPFAASFAGSDLDFVYYQNWDDQNVIQLGGAYQYSKHLTLRAGYNYASNPVPDDTVNFLFPATIESHYTIGLGYLIDKSSGVNFSLAYAPSVTVTESKTETNRVGVPPGSTGSSPPNTVEHSQINWQLMYTYLF